MFFVRKIVENMLARTGAKWNTSNPAYCVAGEKAFVINSAGNLSIPQALPVFNL